MMYYIYVCMLVSKSMICFAVKHAKNIDNQWKYITVQFLYII